MEITSTVIVGILLVVVAVALNTSIKKSHEKNSQNTHTPQDVNVPKYCSTCGAEVHANAIVCIKCGCALAPKYSESDTPSLGLSALSFFFPILGLILFLAYHDKTPRKANGIGKSAIVGFVISIIITILVAIS